MANWRKTDPDTSRDAALSVSEETLTKTQAFILKSLKRPRTDEQLVAAFRAFKTAPWASESGIRSRRAELAKRGLVAIVGESKTASGRRAYVWQIAGDR
jgi:hypothetical protein